MRLYKPDPDQASGKLLHLSSDHHRMLLEESGIFPEIVAERGYRTVRSRAELPEFKKYQRRAPALRVPVLSPDGETSLSQLRPDNPRKDKQGKSLKYETPGGSKVILDVHPRMWEAVRRGDGDLLVTEGIKKADALTSRGLPTVGLIGVWNWQRGGELLPCWDHVALKGRRVYVVFDSDVMAKENVQLALERLVVALEGRGADVRVVYLPDGEGGDKVGVDDYLAAGGTVAELKALARRFEPEDLGRVRLSRDAKLKAIVEELWRIFWAFDWKGMGGHSARDAFEELIRAVERCGKLHGDGVQVKIAWRTLQERANIGSFKTLSKVIARLEEWGLCYRDNEGRKAKKTGGAFVLRAKVYQVGESGAGEEKVSTPLGGFDPGATQLRAPRLRWSDPGRKASRGTVEGTRRVRESRLPARPPRKRLGKIRGAVIDALDVAGGELPLLELYDILNPGRDPEKKRPRDLRRRQLPMLERAGIITAKEELVVRVADRWLENLEEVRERGGKLGKTREAAIEALNVSGGALPLRELYDVLNPGKPPEKRRPRDLRRRQLPRLEEEGIITVKEELVVMLTDNWLEALENARELGGELEAEDLARERHARERKAYWNRDNVESDRHPVNAGADGWSEDLEHPPEASPEGELEPPVCELEVPISPLVAAVRGYLERNPQDACQPPGWIGVVLWADEHYPGKPTPAEIRSAIEELGGESYLRSKLERSREVA